MRRIWLALGTVAAVVALVGGTYAAVSLLAHDEVTRTQTVGGSELDGVSIESDTGDVDVVATDRPDVRVEAVISSGLRRTRSDVVVRDRTLVVRSDCPTGWTIRCRTDYRLEVPHRLAVRVDNGNGSLAVDGLAGDLTVDNSNGTVELADVGGAVRLGASNGSVTGEALRSDAVSAQSDNGEVQLSFADAPRTVRATTHNGSVEVVVPRDEAGYRVEADTRFGETDTAVRTDPASARSIVAETRNGSVTVRYPTTLASG